MSEVEVKALVTQVAAHDVFGDFRYVEKDDGEIWWVVTDVGKILGLKNVRKNVATFPDDEKSDVTISYTRSKNGAFQNRRVLCVNEPGLYRLIFMSRKPEAEKFKRWVFHEVLPSIRQNGYYSLVNEKYQDRKYLHKILPTLTEDEKLSLATEPDIFVYRGVDDKKWRISIEGFASDVR